MNALEKNQLCYFGAGPTAKLACEPLFLDVKGHCIGVLAYAEHEFNWQSDNDWTTGLVDPAANILQIMKLKSKCDKLIVFTHCGPEHCHYPSPRMVRLFHAMIDAGADAVINSHSHAVMGIKQYRGGAICYGLGNFWFPRRGQSGDWNIGLMVRLHLGLSDVTADPIPVEYVPQTGIVHIDSIGFTESLRRISEPLRDEVFIDRKWKEYCLVQKKMLLRSACKASIAMLPAICYRKLFKRSNAKADSYFIKAANLFRSLVTCESYNEILSTIFDQMRKNR